MEPEYPVQEIVIGMVAPLGTDLDRLMLCLNKELDTYGFSSTEIRLSRLLNFDRRDKQDETPISKSEYLMEQGDLFRKTLKSGAALAITAVCEIQRLRLQPPRVAKRAWLIRTFKHEDEVATLREVYGSRFVLIGVNEPEEARRKTLETTLARENPDFKEYASHAAKLLLRDQHSGKEYGQNVRSANQLADFHVQIGDKVISDIKRIVDLLFGKPFETPTRDEHAMYHAYATSLRSSDPGRQVGAVLTSSQGDVIAVGTNEVPRPGGGLYWNNDPSDQRDFQLGRDYNKWSINHVLREILDALASRDHLSETLKSLGSERRLELVSKSLSDARVTSLIEFGRIAHAEMSAILDCAVHGKSTKEATIYVTAFPCHMCMRLIIGAGIRRVVYVDPYPKSLAIDMYGGALQYQTSRSTDFVTVDTFVGASWRIYPRVFTAVNRERNSTNGFFEWYNRSEQTFRYDRQDNPQAVALREMEVLSNFSERLCQEESLSFVKPELQRRVKKLIHRAAGVQRVLKYIAYRTGG